jgi:hypothetical protein
MGLGADTLKIASKVSGSSVSFITEESQPDGRTETRAGSLDTVSGDLRYEARVERLGSTTPGTGGWNRHVRIYASLAMSGGAPSALKSVSFAYANISSPPGQATDLAVRPSRRRFRGGLQLGRDHEHGVLHPSFGNGRDVRSRLEQVHDEYVVRADRKPDQRGRVVRRT